MGNNIKTKQTALVSLETDTLRCRGNWTLGEIGPLERQLSDMHWPEYASFTFDVRAVQRMDTSGAWLLVRTRRELQARGSKVEMLGLSPEARPLFELVGGTATGTGKPARARHPSFLVATGKSSVRALVRWRDLLAFVGEIATAAARTLPHPVRIRWAKVLHELVEAGHKALPIVGLLSFLLGVVIGYQGGVQLRNYGANIFVVDLVGISMLRELAPLITAIIVAGRTGSAYTAEIGTMRVTEEIDALRSLGIAPMDLLVLPKLAALLIALPLLTVFADIVGVFGGMVMANMQLEVSFGTFVERFADAVSLDSYLVGIGKAPVFAAIIVTVGCYQGFQVSGSAESVGRRTTLSVVQSILAVIVVDAAFSVAFSYLGI